MTVPTPTNVTRPVADPTVAYAVLLLVYVTAPGLALVATTTNDASVIFLVVGGLTNASVGAAFKTVSALLVLVAPAYWVVATWVALKLTSPVPTIVIQLPDASIVATLGLLLLYVISPVLLLVGNMVTLKDASLYVFVAGTENVLTESVGVAISTVSMLLVLVALAYWAVAAWVAVNVAVPALKIFILQIGEELPLICKLDMDATVATLIFEVYVALMPSKLFDHTVTEIPCGIIIDLTLSLNPRGANQLSA